MPLPYNIPIPRIAVNYLCISPLNYVWVNASFSGIRTTSLTAAHPRFDIACRIGIISSGAACPFIIPGTYFLNSYDFVRNIQTTIKFNFYAHSE